MKVFQLHIWHKCSLWQYVFIDYLCCHENTATMATRKLCVNSALCEYLMHQSISSTNIPPEQCPRFCNYFQPGSQNLYHLNCLGVGPIIYYHKYQVVSICYMKALFSFKLIYHLLLLFSYKICFKAGGNSKTLSMALKLKLEGMTKE